MALSFWPSLLVGLPNTTKAIKMPNAMLRNTSHINPMPSWAATPPNPTMADVEMKVEPYDRPMIHGLTFLPARRKSSELLVFFQP